MRSGPTVRRSAGEPPPYLVPELGYWVRGTWFASVEGLALIAVLFWLIGRTRDKPEGRLVALLLAVQISELVLWNLQPLVGREIAPYHFSLMFLYPLTSGAGVALLLGRFEPQEAVAKVALVVLCLSPVYQVVQRFSPPESPAHAEILGAVDVNTESDSVVAVMAHHRPFVEIAFDTFWVDEPNELVAITGRYVVHQSLFQTKEAHLRDRARRELMLGVLYGGAAGPVRSCDTPSPGLMGPRTNFSWRINVDRRQRTCAEMKALLAEGYDSCAVIEDIRVDYVAWRAELGAPSKWLSGMPRVWTSADESQWLAQVSRDSMRRAFGCPR